MFFLVMKLVIYDRFITLNNNDFLVPLLLSYKYSQEIVFSILKSLLEYYGKESNNKITHNLLYRNTVKKMKIDRVKKDKRGVKKKGKFKPSMTRFARYIKFLVKWKFVEETRESEGRKRKFYELSDIGKLYLSLYDNKESKHQGLFIIILVVAGKAFFGVHKTYKIKGPAEPGDFGLINAVTKKVTNYRDEIINGVLPEDILNFNDISAQSSLAINDMKISENEILGCIRMLENKGIIQLLGNNGQLRYHVVNRTYEIFLREVWVDLFNLIDERIVCKMCIERPNRIEKDWMVLHYGKRKSTMIINRYHDFRRKLKSNDSSDDPSIQLIKDKSMYIEEKRKKIEDYKDLILEKYNNINQDYTDKLQEIPGFKEILLKLVCPSELLAIL